MKYMVITMNNIKKNLFIMILIVIISFGVVAIELQNDTFYSIKIGEDIIKYRIDFIDHHSFHNLEYLYPHVLVDIITYSVHNIFNIEGLYFFTIIMCILLGIVLFKVNYSLSKNYVFSLLFTLLALFFLKPFITLRAQIFSIILFIFQYYILSKESKNYLLKTILLFIMGVLLVNTHTATFIFYLIMFIPFIIGSKEKRQIIIMLLICSASGLLSFMGLDSYTYLIKTLQNTTTGYIEEHKPLVLKENINIIILFIINIWLFTSNKIRLNTSDKLVLIGVSIMTIVSIRHSMFLMVYTIIIANKVISKYIYEKEKNSLVSIENKMFSIKGMAIVIIIVSLISISSYISNPSKVFINETLYPTKATDYIKNNLDYKNIRIFNDINIGSYMMYQDVPVFIDSRTDLYTYTYNQTRDIFNDYIDVMSFRCYYEDIFDYYDIEYALIPINSSLDTILNKDSNYERLYYDDYFVFYKRNI